MPLNVQDLIEKSSDKLLGNKPVLANPIYTGLIITLILVLITWITLKGEIDVIYDDTSLIALLFKASIIGFLVSLVTMFLHDRAINKAYKLKYENLAAQQIINSATQGPMTTTGIIAPTLNTQPQLPTPIPAPVPVPAPVPAQA